MARTRTGGVNSYVRAPRGDELAIPDRNRLCLVRLRSTEETVRHGSFHSQPPLLLERR